MLATLVVAVALLVGSIALIAVYRSQLLSSLDSTLEQQAADRAQLVARGIDPATLTGPIDAESMVWIGSLDGQSVSVRGEVVPLENPVPPTIGKTTTINILVEEISPGSVERERMDLRVASVTTPDGLLVVLAGAEVETVDKAASDLAGLFAIGLPPVVLLVAALTWFTTGLALRPVEDIRSRAAAISGANLGQRVPVPEREDEIGHLAETMNAMLDRIESHEYSLRQFSADASHELKSPVANLRALVETAEIDDEMWAELRSRLAGETDRLRDLVDNLLFLASHEAGGPVGETAPLALDELLFAEAEMLAATGRVVVDLGDVEPTLVEGSASDLRRLVRNLVDNAARHAESRVAFGVGRSTTSGGGEGRIVLNIGDDGPGIDAEDHERVFDRFTRLDAARARGDGGSGLGLAIVRQIADGHDATVTVGRSPLGGAEFRVVFPARHQPR